jgi:hypothetical protein
MSDQWSRVQNRDQRQPRRNLARVGRIAELLLEMMIVVQSAQRVLNMRRFPKKSSRLPPRHRAAETTTATGRNLMSGFGTIKSQKKSSPFRSSVTRTRKTMSLKMRTLSRPSRDSMRTRIQKTMRTVNRKRNAVVVAVEDAVAVAVVVMNQQKQHRRMVRTIWNVAATSMMI